MGVPGTSIAADYTYLYTAKKITPPARPKPLMTLPAALKNDAMPPVWLSALLLLILAGNIAGLFGVGAHTDEAYYWMWAQHLDIGYYDHPPLVAWMIALTTGLFGDSVWALRLPSVIAWGGIAFVCFDMGRSLFDSRLAGWLSVLVVTSLPILQIGFHIVGPDAPLLLFTALTYWCVYRAMTGSGPRWWWGAGLCLGLALLGKFTAVLLPLTVLFALLHHAQGRRQLATPWPWLASALAALVFLPVVIWNYQHDWMSFGYQWGHGTSTDRGFSWFKVLDYLSQQLTTTMPWVFLGMAYAAIRVRRWVDADRHHVAWLLMMGFWLPLVFFGVTGSMSKIMHNWPIIAFLPGSVLLGGALARWMYPQGDSVRRSAQVIVIIAVILPVVLINLYRFPQWVALLDKPSSARGTAVAWTWGWDQLGDGLKAVQADKSLSPSCRFLFSGEGNDADLGFFHAAGEAGLQLRDASRIVVAPTTHFRQYNIWREQEAEPYRDVCAVVLGPSRKPEFPAMVAIDALGHFVREREITITAPDESQRNYAIYVRTP